MPNMTGFEFLKELQSYGCKVQNIAVMSAAFDEVQRQNIEKVGYKILEKPFKMGELNTWLNECEQQMEPHFKLSNLPGKA